MHIIFCADPLAPRAVDDACIDEAQAALDAGLEYHLISYERLIHEHDAAAAVRRVPAAAASELAIYRGWMMRPSEYQALYDQVAGLPERLDATAFYAALSRAGRDAGAAP
jgi:hypothetical protein